MDGGQKPRRCVGRTLRPPENGKQPPSAKPPLTPTLSPRRGEGVFAATGLGWRRRVLWPAATCFVFELSPLMQNLCRTLLPKSPSFKGGLLTDDVMAWPKAGGAALSRPTTAGYDGWKFQSFAMPKQELRVKLRSQGWSLGKRLNTGAWESNAGAWERERILVGRPSLAAQKWRARRPAPPMLHSRGRLFYLVFAEVF